MLENQEKVENQWKSCENEFPEIVDDWHGGHEGRSRLLWLYQPAHETPDSKGGKMYMTPHIYLGYCCWPYGLKLQEGGTKEWDYGDPFFVILWGSHRASATQWRYIDKPEAPFDELELAFRTGTGTWSWPNRDEAESLPQGIDSLHD